MRVTEETEYLDRRQRSRVAYTLIRSRRAAGLGHDQIGHRVGMSGRQVADLECRRNWGVLTVMAWARANGRVLTVGLGNLIVPLDGDVSAFAYESALRKAERAQDVELMQLRLVHRNLIRVRRAAGVTDAAMAGRLGVTQDAVRLFDANPDSATVGALQRYTRALGGRLRLVLTRHGPARRHRPPSELPPPALAASNSARAAAAAARTAGQARALLETRGDQLNAQDALFLHARAAHPQATLAELAAGCGVTKDRYSSRLRRLFIAGRLP